ncbi:ankyrin [Xylaria digitata]|nr:ankyrin [Xylaria digitata]
MDPLSATASIIALVQAGVGISKGVRFLRSLGQIPLEFSDLLNEFSTLQAAIEQVEAALREWETLSPTANYSPSFRNVNTSNISSLKDDLAQVVNELDTLCDRIRVPRKQGRNQGEKQGCGEHKSVSKLRWQKEKANIARLRHKAQHSRELLSLCFSAFSSSQTKQHMKVTLEIQEVLSTAAENIVQLQNRNTEVEEGSQAILKQLQVSINQLKQELAEQKLPLGTEQTNARPKYGIANGDLGASGLSATPKSVIQFQMVLVRQCSFTCTCNCHQIKYSHSPRWLTNLIGNLFIQYNAIPTFRRPICDKLTCTAKSSSSTRLYYTFPHWLVARAVELDISWSSLTGTGSSLHIRVPRVLELHGIWKAIKLGDLRWIRIQLANKSVLPTDVDRWGQSLAKLALLDGDFKLAKFFVQQGCDIHSKDIFGGTAASTAWRIKVSDGVHQKRHDFEDLSELSLHHRMREAIQSSKVHQTILEDEDERLSALIATDSAELNRLDSFGYAPLHWATRWRKSHIVRTLLEAGATPNILSSGGMNPLELAVLSGDLDSARLLLESGADVNLPNPFTGYTPIFSMPGDAKTLRLLLNYGADVQRETMDGLSTPLDYVAASCYDVEHIDGRGSLWAEWLHCLLSAGLDIDNQPGKDAMAPIMLSLWNRNAILLDLLIGAGARLDLVDSRRNGVLHYAALSTTPTSIEILRRVKISNINPDLPNAHGETPLGWLAVRMYASDETLTPGERRVTTDEFWAFKALIEEIRERNKKTDAEVE